MFNRAAVIHLLTILVLLVIGIVLFLSFAHQRGYCSQYDEYEIYPGNASFGSNLRAATGVWGMVFSPTPAFVSLPTSSAVDKNGEELYPLGCWIRTSTDVYVRSVTGWIPWSSSYGVASVTYVESAASADSIFTVTLGEFAEVTNEWRHKLNGLKAISSVWRPFVMIGDVPFDRHLNFLNVEGNPTAHEAIFVKLFDGYNWQPGQRFMAFWVLSDASSVTRLSGSYRSSELHTPVHFIYNPRRFTWEYH